MSDFATDVKLHVYRTLAATGHAPTSSEVAASLAVPVARVAVAFESLAGERLLVLERDDPGRIRMAPPFSGVETPFPVRVGERRYWANCVWDALGIPAALDKDGRVEAADAHTGEPLPVEVRRDGPVPRECVAHFAVPAARWWDDIVYT